MNEHLKTRYLVSAADTPNIDSAGATSEFVFGGPARVVRCGVIVTTAVDPDNSVDLTATLSRRPTLGSASNAVTLGVLKITTAAHANLAAGTVVHKQMVVRDNDGETAEDSTTRYVAPNASITPVDTDGSPLDIYPGQSFCMTLDTNAEADSGAVISFVEYIDLPWSGAFVDGTNISEDTHQL